MAEKLSEEMADFLKDCDPMSRGIVRRWPERCAALEAERDALRGKLEEALADASPSEIEAARTESLPGGMTATYGTKGIVERLIRARRQRILGDE